MPSPTSKSKPPIADLPELGKPLAQWQFEAIGTQWWIGLYQQISADELVKLQAAVAERVVQFDLTYSRFRPDSLLSSWSRPGADLQHDLPTDAEDLFTGYRRLYDATGGAVTPLVGRPLSDIGYDATYSLKPKRHISKTLAWDDVMTFVPATDTRASQLTLRRPVLLDFGAAGKGYLIDIISRLLQSQGVTAYCVDAGGDMYFTQANASCAPMRIGLENPDDSSQVVGIVDLPAVGMALCGSAGNRRAWGELADDGRPLYNHILDPRSLQSPRHLRAVWVTAASAMLADGLTTALYFTDPDQLRRSFEFEYALIRADGVPEISAGFPGRFFTAS